MLKVGITGGIGSGKSTVSRIFAIHGVPVFNADDAAKELMNTDEGLKKNIQSVFGENIYVNGQLDRAALAKIVFNDKKKLNKLNSFVHPATINYFNEWASKQQGRQYVLKEAAIIFESGVFKHLDKIITVSAPEELRIRRIMKRENITEESVRARIKNQWSEEERNKKADFIIYNDETQLVIPQAIAIHKKISELAMGRF